MTELFQPTIIGLVILVILLVALIASIIVLKEKRGLIVKGALVAGFGYGLLTLLKQLQSYMLTAYQNSVSYNGNINLTNATSQTEYDAISNSINEQLVVDDITTITSAIIIIVVGLVVVFMVCYLGKKLLTSAKDILYVGIGSFIVIFVAFMAQLIIVDISNYIIFGPLYDYYALVSGAVDSATADAETMRTAAGVVGISLPEVSNYLVVLGDAFIYSTMFIIAFVSVSIYKNFKDSKSAILLNVYSILIAGVFSTYISGVLSANFESLSQVGIFYLIITIILFAFGMAFSYLGYNASEQKNTVTSVVDPEVEVEVEEEVMFVIDEEENNEEENK